MEVRFKENQLLLKSLTLNTYKLDMLPIKNEFNIFNIMFTAKYSNILGESNIFKNII